MAEVKVKITSEADLAAMQSTTTELQRQVAAASGLDKGFRSAGESARFFNEVESQRLSQAADTNRSLTAEQDKVSKSARDSAEAMMEAKGPTDKLAGSKGELLKAIKVLSHEIPGLHALVTILKHPIGLLALGFGYLVKQVLDSVNAFKEAGKEIHQFTIANDRLTNPLAKNATLARESAQFHEDLADRLGQVAAKSGDAAGNLERITEELRRQQQLADELDDAQMAVELARAGDDPEARAGIRMKFAGRKTARQQAALEQQAQLQFARAGGLSEQARLAGLAIPGAEAEFSAAQSANFDEQARMAQRSSLREVQKKRLQKEVEEADAILTQQTGLLGGPSIADHEEARTRRDAALAGLGMLAREGEGDKARAGAAGRRLGRAGAALESLRTTAATAPGEAQRAFQAGQGLRAQSAAIGTAGAARSASESQVASIEADNKRAAEALKLAEKNQRETHRLLNDILGKQSLNQDQLRALDQRVTKLTNQ